MASFCDGLFLAIGTVHCSTEHTKKRAKRAWQIEKREIFCITYAVRKFRNHSVPQKRMHLKNSRLINRYDSELPAESDLAPNAVRDIVIL